MQQAMRRSNGSRVASGESEGKIFWDTYFQFVI